MPDAPSGKPYPLSRCLIVALTGTRLMSTIVRDVRFSLRALRRRRTFAAVAIATIALGIGAATSIYSVVDGVLLRPLPFREPAMLAAVWQTFPDWKKEPILASEWDHITLALPEYRDLRDRARSFESIAVWAHGRALLVEDGRSELVSRARVSASMLEVLGVRPALGRMFLPAEDVPNAPDVAMVSFEQWQSRYGGDRKVVGRTVHFEEEPFTIVGVLPPDLTLGKTRGGHLERPAFWIPVGANAVGDYDVRTNHSYTAVARLAPGVTLDRAQQEAAHILAENNDPSKEGTRVVEWHADQTRDARAPMLILLAGVGLLLVIACVNVAVLLLGESAGREHEMAARLALGASRTRLVGQMLTESVVLAALGGVIGAALAWGGTHVFVGLAPPRIAGLADVHMNIRVLAVAVTAVVATGILFGLAPAVALANTNPGTLLRAGTGQSVGGRGALQRMLIAAELALSVVLLVGAGLLSRSFERITRVDPGFQPENLLVVKTVLPRAMLRDPGSSNRLYESATARLRPVPGITAVTVGSDAPFGGDRSSSSFVIEGETGRAASGGGPSDPGDTRHQAERRSVLAGYFATLGIPILAGREFAPEDRAGAPNVVVVSEALARRDFPSTSPLGKRVRFQGEWRTIVGVVGDVHTSSLALDVQPAIYMPVAQRDEWSLTLVVRTSGRPAAMAPTIRRVLGALDARLTITEMTPMPELVRRSSAEERYRATLMSIFAALAAVLAAVGMYGVTSRAVARRSREMGIRLALGATEWSVVRQVVAHSLVGLAVGVMLGLVGARAASTLLSPFLFGVRATDPATYAAIVVLLGTIGVVASWLPARRAGRIAPASVLRAE
jgi:predicted permease